MFQNRVVFLQLLYLRYYARKKKQPYTVIPYKFSSLKKKFGNRLSYFGKGNLKVKLKLI